MKPSEELMSVSTACRVHFTWLGTRKALTPGQREKAAEVFDAQGSELSASKRLIDTKHKSWMALAGVRRDARNYWQTVTLPYPEDGVRLLKRSDVDSFQAKMEEFRDAMTLAVSELDGHYAELKEIARHKLSDLYNAADYPDTLVGAFAMDWDYPSLEPPEYLMKLNPALFEQERLRMAAKFEEATKLAEMAFAEELKKLTAHLADMLTDGPEGRKQFRSSCLENLNAFFDNYGKMSIRSSAELDALVEQAKAVVGGLDPKEVRSAENDFRADLAAKMVGIAEAIEANVVTAPKRRISLPNQGDAA